MRQGTRMEMTSGPSLNLRNRLVLGTALATSAFVGGYRGYLRRAYADCAGAGGTYTCSGVTTTTQTLTIDTPLTVTTVPGFSIDTTGTGGNAFTLNGTGGLSFTDNNLSTIIGGSYGYGIGAANTGTGALSITATGTVTGDFDGINAVNFGTGELSITATGAVTSNIGDGISAFNDGTNLTINTAGVTGALSGIVAVNNGSSALSISTSGAVSGESVDGSEGQVFGGYGIRASNNGTSLTINADGEVRGASSGIVALNSGTGALTITASGAVNGDGEVFEDYGSAELGGYGIYANNNGTSLTINANGEVRGALSGIVAHNNGSGALAITASGAVIGNAGTGIYAVNESAADSSTTAVTVESGATVSGATAGVQLVSDTGRAGSLENAGSIAGVTGVLASTAGPVTITNAGSITGTGGTAINLTNSGPSTVNQQGGVISGNFLLSASDDVVRVAGGTITGNVEGEGGDDTINVSGGSVEGAVRGGDGSDEVTISGGTINGGIDAETVRLNGGTIHGNITGLSGNTLIIQAENLSLDNGVLFQGTNVIGTITGTNLPNSANFAGFSSVTLNGQSTLQLAPGVQQIASLQVLDGSTLVLPGAVSLVAPTGGPGNLAVTNATLNMQNGNPTDVFNVGNLSLNGATLAIDVNPRQNLSDLINAAGLISTAGANLVSVNLIGLPNLTTVSVIPLAPVAGEIAPASGAPSAFFSAIGNSPIAGVFDLSVITGADGGLYLVVAPTAAGLAAIMEPRAAIDSQPIETVTMTVYDILNDAVLTQFNLMVSASRADAAPGFGIYASGQAAYVKHDGFNVSGAGFSGPGPAFTANDFSLAASVELNAAEYFGLDQSFGLDVGMFGGYALSEVELDPTLTFPNIGSGDNRSGMIGSYGLFRSGTTYGLVSATGFFGNTDIVNGILQSTGDYGTAGVAVTGSAGHVYQINDNWRFDLRGGILGVYFEGDAFEDSKGNDFGRSHISFGAVKLEPGIFAQYPMEDGRILSPYARLELTQRFGYENESSLEGVDFFFDDADFSASFSGGVNYQISKMTTVSSELRSKVSTDSTTFAGKIGLKARF